MAWPYSGSWDGQPVTSLPSILSALFERVNKYSAAVGASVSATLDLVDFYDGSGEKNYPSAADMAGLARGPNYRTNLVRLYDRVEDLFDGGLLNGHHHVQFVEPDGDSWAPVEIPDGAPAISGPITNTTLYSWAQEALDELGPYLQISLSSSSPASLPAGIVIADTFSEFTRSKKEGFGSTLQAAWDAALAASPTTDTTTLGPIQIHIMASRGASNYQVLFLDNIVAKWRTGLYPSGLDVEDEGATTLSANWGYDEWVWWAYTLAHKEFTFNGDDYDVDVDLSGAPPSMDINLSLGSDTDYELSWADLPSTCPIESARLDSLGKFYRQTVGGGINSTYFPGDVGLDLHAPWFIVDLSAYL